MLGKSELSRVEDAIRVESPFYLSHDGQAFLSVLAPHEILKPETDAMAILHATPQVLGKLERRVHGIVQALRRVSPITGYGH